MPRVNLNSLFEEFARFSRDIAVVQRRGYRREVWTYAKLRSVAFVCADEFRQRGVGTGDRVLLWGPNSAEWMASFWACLLLGAVAVPLDDGATPVFASRVTRETSARVIVSTREKARQMPTSLKPLDPIGTAISWLALEDLPDLAAQRRVFVGKQRPPDQSLHDSWADEPITRNHVAQILFTSGTTGDPRGVVLTHGNFLANLKPLEHGIDPYRKYEKWFHPLRFVSLIPLSHVFGQFMALFVPPLLGATVVFENSANPSEITRTIKRERAIALIAVPRMLDSLRANLQREFQPTSATSRDPQSSQIEHPGWPAVRASASSEGWVAPSTQRDREAPQVVDSAPTVRTSQVSESRQAKSWLDRTFLAAKNKKFLHRAWLFRRIHRRFGWKFWAFISGGAALSPDTEEFFKRIGYAVVQGYGMTETASLISLNHPFRATQGSIGKVLPGREFKLAGDGEILVRGENISAGYWQSGALQPSADSEWLHTGDIGELDAQGNLHFRGRKKSVIVTPAGLNIYPEDLEAALRRQPQVRDAVVIPIERGGNAEPCAVLLPTSPPRVPGRGAARGAPARQDANFQQPPRVQCANSDEAINYAVAAANRSLAEYQQIHSWLTWPEPDFPRTPTGKPRLAEITARALQMLSGAHGANAKGVPGNLEDLINRFGRPTAHSGTQHLEQELNLTSLDRVELMNALEQRYHVELSETAFAEAKTIGDVERLLRGPSGQADESTGPLTLRPLEYVYPRWTQSQPIRALSLTVYYVLVWPATQILGHPKIVGRENLRHARGPFLIVSNHITRRADIGLVLAALPPRLRHHLATAAGAETLREMRHPPQSWFFAKRWAYQLGYWLVTALFNVFPLPQFSGFRESFRFAAESIDRGYSVLIFPEGEVNNSDTGEMAKFQSGIGLLAQNLQVPIIPIRLDGVWQMKREHRRLARFGEITVHIARPVTFPPGTPPAEIAEQLQALVLNA